MITANHAGFPHISTPVFVIRLRLLDGGNTYLISGGERR